MPIEVTKFPVKILAQVAGDEPIEIGVYELPVYMNEDGTLRVQTLEVDEIRTYAGQACRTDQIGASRYEAPSL